LALYAIADLHLGRDMSVFGPQWENHEEKIVENWCRVVDPEDTVFVLGDISWAMRLEEAEPHFKLLKSLPGKKRILKGNHDYWWATERKMKMAGFIDGNIKILQPEILEGVAVCGTRGWILPGHPQFQEEADGKVYRRELLRLEMALKSLLKIRQEEPILVMMHYPPALPGNKSGFINLMEGYGVKKCYYGHLHGSDQVKALVGNHWGIEFHLVAADYVDFTPVLVKA